MQFLNINITKNRKLNVVYKNEQGDIISVVGANLVHKDLKACFNALIPHLAISTEQRETYNRTLNEIEADKIQDDTNTSVFRWLNVTSVRISEDGNVTTMTGTRILQSGDVIKIESPSINVEQPEKYAYTNDLDLAIEAVKYEAEAYLNEQKWGVKEASIDFGEDDPFNAENLTADQVPNAGVDEQPKKERKAKIKKIKAA